MTTEQNALSTVQVFISHVHEDNASCEPLLLALDAWDVDYWFDRTAMRPRDAISAAIHDALTERNIFIRICTASMQHRPRWVQVETDMFLGLKAQQDGTERGGSRRFISLIMDAGFRLDKLARDFAYIDAYNKPPRTWLREMRKALGLVIEKEDGTREDTLKNNLRNAPGAARPTIAARPNLALTGQLTLEQMQQSLEQMQQLNERVNRTRSLSPRAFRPALVLVKPSQPQSFALEVGPTIIARTPIDEIHLNDSAVSRIQATVTCETDGTCSIRDGLDDQRSTNGTFVNGEKLGKDGRVLNHGDQILVGETILRFTLIE